AAIKKVQVAAEADGRDLDVWVTLPVTASGLTGSGQEVVRQMLAAGVDLRGVNGMTMNFGLTTTVDSPQGPVIVQAAQSLQAQLVSLWEQAGRSLSVHDAWAKVGLTMMAGQNDIPTEQLTLADAELVNQFARDHGVGLLSMWSLNRDSTCAAPLPK